jgi:hypothetical protein
LVRHQTPAPHRTPEPWPEFPLGPHGPVVSAARLSATVAAPVSPSCTVVVATCSLPIPSRRILTPLSLAPKGAWMVERRRRGNGLSEQGGRQSHAGDAAEPVSGSHPSPLTLASSTSQVTGGA